MSAADLLRRAADDYRALAAEHDRGDRVERGIAEAIELVLRQVADALEAAEHELEEAA